MFQQQKGNWSHDRECDCWHLPQCAYFKKDKCEVGQDCPFIHRQKKKRSTCRPRKERGKAKESDKEKVTVAIVNIANHRPRNTSGKLLHFETSRNCHDDFAQVRFLPEDQVSETPGTRRCGPISSSTTISEALTTPQRGTFTTFRYHQSPNSVNHRRRASSDAHTPSSS